MALQLTACLSLMVLFGCTQLKSVHDDPESRFSEYFGYWVLLNEYTKAHGDVPEQLRSRGVKESWRVEIHRRMIPRPMANGEKYFRPKEGRIFEFNFQFKSPETIKGGLAELPGFLIIGFEILVPAGFDWTSPTSLSEMHLQKELASAQAQFAIREIDGKEGFTAMLADGTIVILSPKTPVPLMRKLLDPESAGLVTPDELDAWIVSGYVFS